MDRVILHSDMNNFYASVECLFNPQIRQLPVAVCGDPQARHGIVLAKNQLAKSCGIITGEAIWQARAKCPTLHIVPPDYGKYLFFARKARRIYEQYTDQVEPFGLDESWLDISAGSSVDGFGIANEIRQRIRSELGLTVSIGVSFNKVFAKLGSDLKKPDAVTVISKDNFKEKVWPLPAAELLYVGRSTRQKLRKINISTIGDLAVCDLSFLQSYLGRWGYILWLFANGLDDQPVRKTDEREIVKSVGNSTTTPRDLLSIDDVRLTIYVLAESVAARLRDHGLKCCTVQISVRDTGLFHYDRQQKLAAPTCLSTEIARTAIELFQKHHDWQNPVRSLGVKGADLIDAAGGRQLSFLQKDLALARLETLEKTIDGIRERYGYFSIQKAVMLSDRELTDLNPRQDHVIHPVSYFG